MRAADADRQAVADQLKAALDEGRLDLHEYDERLQQAYAAKTYGDLQPLLGDLPAAALPVPAQRGALAAPAGNATSAELTRRWVMEVWASWIPVVGVTSAIWLISSISAGELLNFWPIWVAGPWGAVLIFITLTGLATGEPRKQAEKKARKEQAKQLKRERKALELEADESVHPATNGDENRA
ncbi:DUF1707 domain-containing protein [Actinoplanes sp. NPDC049599]|uniref:DUF1707 domain-containing protein n=1 Tax=Actinoplanes sp. NPDC049599 TaxID=3363903 RepID=UPI0037AA8349